MSKGTGKAQSVPVSLYPSPHIEIINDAINNKGYQGVAEFIQHLIEVYGFENRKRFSTNLLHYIIYPFLVIALLLLYSRASENIILFWVGGLFSSLFFYSVYIGTLKMRGIDPRTHGRKKRKDRMEWKN